MAKIDRILSLVLDQGANELRLGTDREPKMLAYGATKRLALPSMDAETVRDLLGEILSPERDELLRTRGRIDTSYEASGLGTFAVTLTARADGFDAVFRRSSATAIAHASASAASSSSSASYSSVDAMPVAASAASATSSASAPPPSVREPAVSVATNVAVHPALAELVAEAAARRASDIHLADGTAPVARIDGRLEALDGTPIDVGQLFSIGELRAGSLDLGLDIPGVGRVRAHVFRSEGRSAASIRLLPRSAPSLASLNLPVPLDDLISLPHGLVLVCGAAGSGKSTTLAALAQEVLRRRSVVLVTLEDPIEYALAPSERSVLRRRQIGRDVSDFATGLRDALREDPDVLLVGEMRDPETIGLALTAAETGHLVFATLHSRSAGSAVERIVDSYPPERALQVRTQLADSLRAVVAQRLVPRASGSGRVPALEVARVNHAVATMIREGKTAQIGSAIQSGRKEGMISLERCLADRVAAGEVRLEDARAAANDPSALAMQMQR